MIRRVGIDFGTSTTVVRVKNYEDDGKTYIQDRLGCQVVMFGEFPTVPTLGRQMEDGTWIWGHEAVKERKNSVLYQNFKMDMTHPEKSKKAEELIFGFFKYLYACYSEQDTGGFFGEQGVRTETVISYPVKWQSDQVELLLAAAAQAGFQNVTHMNEAKAAVIAALQQNSDKLCDLGIRRRGDKLKLLLVDMGAGTTDLVLGEYTYDEKEPKWRLISCWPVDEKAATCGGREIDEVLRQFIKTALEAYGEETGGTEIYLRLLQNPKNLPAIKAWKEKDVSDELAKGGTVTDCDVMYNCAGGDIVPFEPITKDALEKLLGGYISDLIGLVNGCIDNDPEKQNPVDAVLLVGGSSRWYFVPELFAGKGKNGKKIVLKRVQEKPGERIMRLVRPQETVAMGLVLSALPLEVQGDVEIRETETEQAPKQKLQEMQDM
ncbi:MAG: Hsp70 family protein, partial [Clostridia bacterium]|nr:Hsp70 family protein [Clostridia bacterium]